MKYTVITTTETFEFSMGQLGVNKTAIACMDADGTKRAIEKAELVAVLRSDLADSYLEYLESQQDGQKQ